MSSRISHTFKADVWVDDSDISSMAESLYERDIITIVERQFDLKNVKVEVAEVGVSKTWFVLVKHKFVIVDLFHEEVYRKIGELGVKYRFNCSSHKPTDAEILFQITFQ